MSHLSLYRPEAEEHDEPVILSFADFVNSQTINFQQAVLERARSQAASAGCPVCRGGGSVGEMSGKPR